MKANLLHKDIPVRKIQISFIISHKHIETAIISIWLKGLKATKGRIAEEITDMFYSGGHDGIANWVHDDDREGYVEKAKEISKKLFPTFYKNN